MMEIEEIWPRVPIVEHCDAHVDCVNRTASVVAGPTPYKMIRTTNVRDGYIDTENVRYVTESTFQRWTRRLIPKKDDVILTREAPLGNVGKLRSTDSIFLGQRLYHFRANAEKLDPDFLLYSLLGPDLQGQIHGFGSGSTVSHMRLENIPSLTLPLPQISMQRKIGGILGAYDELIVNNQRRIRILEEMVRSLYREWFVHFRFPGHENHPRAPSPRGEIPQGWKQTTLGSISTEVRHNIKKGRLDEDVPYVGLEHIPRRSLALDDWEMSSELGSNKLAFQRGDMLFGKIRPYFHKVVSAPFDGICSADTIVIRAEDSKYGALVSAVVSSDQFVALVSASANGSKMPRANWKIMASEKVLLPPDRLLEKFSQVVTPAINLMQTLITQNRNLRQTRDLLLPRLLSGQIKLEAN